MTLSIGFSEVMNIKLAARLLILSVTFILLGKAEADQLRFFGATLPNPPPDSYKKSFATSFVIDEENRRIHYDGDVSLVMIECETERWICISDGYFEFSLPRDWQPDQTKWRYRDIDYELLGQDPNLPFPNDPELHVIIRRPDPIAREQLPSMLFVYSREFGLVGIIMELGGDEEPINAVYFRAYGG